MISTTDRPSGLVTSRGASVATRYDQRLCAHLDVRTEYGLRAARAGAGLVREAIVAARAQGLRTAELTLDVASPVTGAVLELLRDLVHDDVADLRVRRAGGTVLVEVELAAHPPVHDGDAPPARGGGRHLTELSRRLGAA